MSAGSGCPARAGWRRPAGCHRGRRGRSGCPAWNASGRWLSERNRYSCSGRSSSEAPVSWLPSRLSPSGRQVAQLGRGWRRPAGCPRETDTKVVRLPSQGGMAPVSWFQQVGQVTGPSCGRWRRSRQPEREGYSGCPARRDGSAGCQRWSARVCPAGGMAPELPSGRLPRLPSSAGRAVRVVFTGCPARAEAPVAGSEVRGPSSGCPARGMARSAGCAR